MPDRFYNAHAHCFTYDHVPKYFISRRIATSKLLSLKWFIRVVRKVPLTGKFNFLGQILIFLLSKLFGINKNLIIRFLNFVKYGDQTSQKQVIKSMQQYYPKHTGFVSLTMDMEYMGAGYPKKRFEKQLLELEELKNNNDWKNTFYPFVFCDPRRIKPIHQRELSVKSDFTNKIFLEKVIQLISEKSFQGIKLYPALGYYPFDNRMKPIYDFALRNDVPLTTHCSVGAVHFKYRLDDAERNHPFLKENLPHKKPKKFQQYFTHPLNFECLLNHDLLKTYWGEDATDYFNLKLCFGHWGSAEEWHNFIGNAWVETHFEKMDKAYPSLELINWHTDKKAMYNFSWFTIICDMIRKYPNVYADISYTLGDASLLPLLKMILESDNKIRSRVLFGTDFYMVSKDISEREFAINVRAFLGVHLFNQISIYNAKQFLSNYINPV
jgi:predicted TIM-barrel fold metal-dependent hydrolase